MDTPAKAALGGGLISTLAFGGIVAAGVLATSATVVLTDPAAPTASAAALVPFRDCASLREWYVDHTLDQVGPWGWGGPAVPLMAEDMGTRRSAGATPDKAVVNGSTGTNTQETDVDEPDVAKTDGRIVVRLQDGRRLVVTDVTGTAPRELASWQLPASSYAEGLLLVGDHVLVSNSSLQLMGREGFLPPRADQTELYDVDLSDPAHPHLADTSTLPGRQLSMRQYGDTVRLVTSIGLPALPFLRPRGTQDEARTEQRNREIVRSSRIEDWIPGLDCSEVYHPRQWSGNDTVAVTTFHPGSFQDATKVAVTGAGSEVYSSSDRLYVTSTDWRVGAVTMGGPDTTTRSDIVEPYQKTRTHIHAFALDGDTTRYVASGVVNGRVRDRWSLDEYDGHLRVAVSWPAQAGTGGENGVVVLEEKDGRLDQVGELAGLGVGEEIQSVRWFDDLAVVVTFRQMDPLYTIDLSDPTDPHRLGELKIPGFSAYLHPIGDDRLLGLGSDATPTGQNLGAQAAVFDLSDATSARQVGKVTFGDSTMFEAAQDPHAFTWLPDARSAIANLQRGSGSVPVLLHVSPDGSVSASDLPSVGGWGQRALPLDGGRVALVGDSVRIVNVNAG